MDVVELRGAYLAVVVLKCFNGQRFLGFLHVVFDKWMDKYHPEKPFEMYSDDIVVH